MTRKIPTFVPQSYVKMNTLAKYILGILAVAAVLFFSWYFFSIIVYVLVSAVLSFIGKPVVVLLGKVQIRGHRLSDTLKAVITLVILWIFFLLFFSTVIPLAVHEYQSLENVSTHHIIERLQGPLQDVGRFLKDYGIMHSDEDVNQYITDQLGEWLKGGRLRNWFGSVVGTVSDIFVALFSISFITFFFLKDNRLFSGMVLATLPERYKEQGNNALESIEKLLVRYFVGLLLEVLGVMTLNVLGLSILGLGFGNAVVIGLMAGILNVIPYIGPLIGTVFGLMTGVLLNLDMEFYGEMLPLLLGMAGVMLFTLLMDNIIFQPLIYGNSVHAHPLEIFLVLLMAGSMAGIPGMILGIPVYTVVRVILKEFFNKYELVKKLTHSL